MDLSSRAMLARISMSAWSAVKRDKEETKKLNERHGTRDAGHVDKKLIMPEAAATYAAILSAQAALRKEFDSQTLPWGRSLRILPAANYLKLGEMVAARKQVILGELLPAFLQEYPALREGAKVFLNGMWKAADYPDVAEMAGRFAVQVQILPFPNSNDFRVTLGAEEAEAVKRQIEADVREASNAAMKDAWSRLREALEKFSATMQGTTRKADGRTVPAEFRDTLFSNVAELCDLLPRLNLAGDPKLDKLAAETREKLLSQFQPEQVRRDPDARKLALSEVDRLLGMMPR